MNGWRSTRVAGYMRESRDWKYGEATKKSRDNCYSFKFAQTLEDQELLLNLCLFLKSNAWQVNFPANGHYLDTTRYCLRERSLSCLAARVWDLIICLVLPLNYIT
jgi:hypothetical protein